MLLVWAVQHPATGYFQGLNDLASPFLYSFLSHHSTYQVGQPGFFYNNDEDEGEEEGDDEGDARRHDGEYSPGLLQRVEADVYWCLCSVMESVEVSELSFFHSLFLIDTIIYNNAYISSHHHIIS